MSRRWLAAVCVAGWCLALVATGCSRGSSLASKAPAVTVTPTSEVPSPTGATTATTGAAPGGGPSASTGSSTTAPAGGGTPCPAQAALPADARPTARRSADVDADGRADQLTTYSVGTNPGSGAWHLRAELGAGGGADYVLVDDPAPAPFQVLGTASVGPNADPGPGGARPVIFAWMSSGASAKVVGLYRLDGCTLVALTLPGGGPATMVAGGSIGHQEGARCEVVAGVSLLVEVTSEAVGSNFSVTERAYSRTGNSLTPYGSPQVRTSAGPPPEAGRIACGDVVIS